MVGGGWRWQEVVGGGGRSGWEGVEGVVKEDGGVFGRR